MVCLERLSLEDGLFFCVKKNVQMEPEMSDWSGILICFMVLFYHY